MGMQLMVEGDKWEMYIPSELGYGDGGSGKIKGGDVLIFQMEILKIKGDKVPADKCDPVTKNGCSEKQTALLDKIYSRDPESRKKELERLKRLASSSMSEAKKQSIQSRLNMMQKVVDKDEL